MDGRVAPDIFLPALILINYKEVEFRAYIYDAR